MAPFVGAYFGTYMVAIPFNLSKSFEVSPEKGIAFCDANGIQVGALVAGNGSPVGEQAPIGSLYLDNTAGDFWQKVGPDTTDSQTGWLKNGKGTSFTNATDFEGFESLSSSTTNSSTYQTKLNSITGEKEGGKYYLGWSYQAGHSKKANVFETRVQLDTGSGFFDIYEASQSVAQGFTFLLISGFTVLDALPAAIGGYTIRMQFRELGTGTALVKNVSIILYRLGD